MGFLSCSTASSIEERTLRGGAFSKAQRSSVLVRAMSFHLSPVPLCVQNVTDRYKLGKVLGRGQFGTTRLATDLRTNKVYACKSIPKSKLVTKEDREDVRREVQIMHHLNGHPNITFLVAAMEDRTTVHLVMDLCSGGELFDRISKEGHFTEATAASIIRTLLSVVAHCHSLGVVHRDLKPENFLMSTPGPDAQIKCADFGLSCFFKPGEHLHDLVGSAFYVAPEVLKRNYGPECDIWSCGVILYILLSGMPPFWGNGEQEIFDSVAKGVLDFTSDPWPTISDEAKDCVRCMLVKVRTDAGPAGVPRAWGAGGLRQRAHGKQAVCGSERPSGGPLAAPSVRAAGCS